MVFQHCRLVNLVGSFCLMLFFPEHPVFVTPGCLQTLKLEGESLVLLLLWFNSLQLLMLWAVAPNSALGQLIMETLALGGCSKLAEILLPIFRRAVVQGEDVLWEGKGEIARGPWKCYQ